MGLQINYQKTKGTPSPQTFILMWNPAISSYTMERFEDDLKEMADGWVLDDFDWSVWEWEKARVGDKFYMIRVGEGKTGVVMSGEFTSEPYVSEDWAGKGRKVYYMQMDVQTMIHPNYSPLLTTEELTKMIPEFEWSKGHSGQLLDSKNAKILDKLWNEYLKKYDYIFNPRAAKL